MRFGVPARTTPTKLSPGHRNLLGPHLRKLREAKGLTQNEVVAALQRDGWDVSRHVFGYVEDGSRAITDLELFAILKVLKSSPIDLQVVFQDFCNI